LAASSPWATAFSLLFAGRFWPPTSAMLVDIEFISIPLASYKQLSYFRLFPVITSFFYQGGRHDRPD